MWPSGIGRWPMDLLEKDSLEEWEIVPRGLENIALWSQVAPHLSSRDLSRQHLFVHIDGEGSDLDPDDSRDLYQITLRLQGILGAHNLATLGTWDGTEKNACKATQFAMLEPGPFEESFNHQRSSLTEVQTFILKRLGCRSMDPAPESVVTASDDPKRLTPSVAARWRVVDKTVFGCRLSETEGRECDSIIFNKGDFVDVAVTIDIAVHRGRTPADAPVTSIHYDLKHVMLLRTAAELDAIINPTIARSPAKRKMQRIMNTGITFKRLKESLETMSWGIEDSIVYEKLLEAVMVFMAPRRQRLRAACKLARTQSIVRAPLSPYPRAQP
ncbi:hypothetical protein FA95DRAFT_1671901 [Auriscalpium vulgare]|uniref:Uncharacterized protein n=1 Tax=Auriscalpium vulgare TaxID=40419 RepID=A0ACB8R258_9AGAM|nr:hypothetical protein FA95DRAFT_1671901 [Auriscalpium vulgare]